MKGTVVRLQGNAKAADASLANFKDCNNLVLLSVVGTSKSDAGLENLNDSKSLAVLSRTNTKITAAMVAELRQALPKCRIESDHGTFEPK